jgi:hypothetical protein
MTIAKSASASFRRAAKGLTRAALVAAYAVTALLGGCGKKPEGGGGSGPSVGAVEAAFLDAAAEYGIPARYMMATAWLESRLAPEKATSNYITVAAGADSAPVARGTLLTETAFGLSYETLGLDAVKDTAQLLETQIPAYAAWLSAEIQTAGLTLASDPESDEDRFYWLENLAALHRRGMAQRRNVQIIFAKELIEILNKGFIWQDPRTGERLELEPEREPIDPFMFPEDGRNWMTLTELKGQIYVASYLPLVTVPSDEFENHPKRVEVIHCPLTLSACLELQTRSEESEIHLAAHYVIPDDPMVFQNVIQVADHREALILTNQMGENVAVADAIVIMLVGNSGRSVDGDRKPALPTWFSDQQLRLMAQVVNDVCTLLGQETPADVNVEECVGADGDNGVRFRHQAQSEEYRWGDIADFDAPIFEAYVRNPAGLSQEVAFEFKSAEREFDAGDEIPLTLRFGTNARTIELERLNRCADGRVIWEPLRIDQVRSEKKMTVDATLYDSGPNASGDQFFRARVYGNDGRLVGWSIDRVVLSGFEPETAYASEKYCR